MFIPEIHHINLICRMYCPVDVSWPIDEYLILPTGAGACLSTLLKLDLWSQKQGGSKKKLSNSYYPLINYDKLTWLVEISTFSIGNTVHLTIFVFHFPARLRQSTRVYHVFFFSEKKPGHKIPLPIDRLKVPGKKNPGWHVWFFAPRFLGGERMCWVWGAFFFIETVSLDLSFSGAQSKKSPTHKIFSPKMRWPWKMVKSLAPFQKQINKSWWTCPRTAIEATEP